MTPDASIAVRNAADLVDATPYVIGFHPTDSLVVLGLSGDRVSFGARYDLPPPDGDDIVHLGAVIAAQRARCVAVLAYGPPATVDPVVRRALAVLQAFRVRVLEAVRVHDGRWWSYFCADPGCCPSEGTAFDTAASLIAAEATFRGQVALPSRQALVALVAPVDGAAREAMTAATQRARSKLEGLLTADEHQPRAIRRAGRLAVREAEKRYRSGRALTDDEVAWLGALLLEPDVHEYTLGRVGDEEWRLALWTDVLRRVEPRYVPVVGCVLSYLAWRAGQGALARVAVDRALHAQPQHRMAGLLDEVLGMGIGPHAMSALDSPPRAAALPDRAQSDRAEPDHAEPGCGESDRAEPGCGESGRAESDGDTAIFPGHARLDDNAAVSPGQAEPREGGSASPGGGNRDEDATVVLRRGKRAEDPTAGRSHTGTDNDKPASARERPVASLGSGRADPEPNSPPGRKRRLRRVLRRRSR